MVWEGMGVCKEMGERTHGKAEFLLHKQRALKVPLRFVHFHQELGTLGYKCFKNRGYKAHLKAVSQSDDNLSYSGGDGKKPFMPIEKRNWK